MNHLLKYLTVIFIFGLTLPSCKKFENEFFENKKLGISINEKREIENQFKGFKFNNNNNSNSKVYFENSIKSKDEIIEDLNDIKKQLDQYFHKNNVTLKTNLIDTKLNLGRLDDEGPGDTVVLPTVIVTATNILSGGLFSTFTLTFNYTNNSISGQALLLIGPTVGWWWNSGYSGTTGPNTGYTQGSATYFYGIGTYSVPYQINYTYNPDGHTLTYYWSDALSHIN